MVLAFLAGLDDSRRGMIHQGPVPHNGHVHEYNHPKLSKKAIYGI